MKSMFGGGAWCRYRNMIMCLAAFGLMWWWLEARFVFLAEKMRRRVSNELAESVRWHNRIQYCTRGKVDFFFGLLGTSSR